MAISYVSQVAKSNPYVLPFDLNLMARVLQYKETNFIQNSQKIQQGINSLSALEMKNKEGQDYLNSKVNSLVSKINDFGAVDLSDMNMSNQLDHMVNSLPQDDVIMTQVSGMKLGRKMAAEYDKFRTDPKMKGMYSDANYNWSMEQFNKWRMESDPTSPYSGPTTATPFFDVNKFYHDNLKQVRSQIAQTITRPDGTNMYYMKNSTELIDEGTLKQIVNDLTFSDPRVSQQSQINSWYTAKGKTPEMIVGSLNESIDYEVTSTNGTIQYLKDQIQLNPNDSNLRNTYNSQIQNLETYVKSLKEKKSGYTVDNYNKNPDQFNFLDYQTRTARAFGNIYKVNKQTKDLKLDNSWYLQKKLIQQDEANEIAAAKAGFARVNGKLVSLDPNGNMTSSSIFAKSQLYDKDWTIDPDALKYGEGMLKTLIAGLNTEESEISVGAITQAIKNNPNIEGIWTKELQDELTRRGQLINRSDTVFDFDDLQYVNDIIKEGNLGKFINIKDTRPYPTRTEGTTGVSLSDPLGFNKPKTSDVKAIEFASTILTKMYDVWKNGALSSAPDANIDFNELGLTDAVNSIQTVRRKKNIYNNLLKESLSSAGLSEKEQTDYIDYLENPSKYQTFTSSSADDVLGQPSYIAGSDLLAGAKDNSYILGIKDKLKGNKAFFENISMRFQPVGFRLFDQKDLGEKELGGKKIITGLKSQISNYLGRGFYADVQNEENIFNIPNKNESLVVTDEDISDVVIYKLPDNMPNQGMISGFNTKYYASAIVTTKDGEKTVKKKMTIPLDHKAIYSELGNIFELPIDQQLTNDEVVKFGSTNVVYNPQNTNFRVQFRIVGLGDNGVELYPKSKVQIVVTDKNARTGKSYISVFGTKTFNTPAEAEREGRGIVDYYIKNTPSDKINIKDLADRLQNKL